jgi:hypothetical protein
MVKHKIFLGDLARGNLYPFYSNRTLALKETTNNTKQPKKNENYNEILEKPFIFNIQTVPMVRRCCRSSSSRPDVVGCGWEVVEWVKKTTSVSKNKKKKKKKKTKKKKKKKEELPMKLLDDPKIPIAR